jgi:hypothetical protein
MEKKKNTSLTTESPKEKRCVSCGLQLSGRKRRYCSKECKELLVFALSWLKNLLLPLNTNYATFSFTDSVLIINILSFLSTDVSTYLYRRVPGMTPAEGLKDACKSLNREWYEKNRESRSRRAASEHLLKIGLRDLTKKDNVTPISIVTGSRIDRKLSYFNLNLEDLGVGSADTIKSAYRKEIKKHHPDYGGNTTDFIKVSEAYKDILTFMKNPTVRERRGLPGKWSYDGSSYKWSAPL